MQRTRVFLTARDILRTVYRTPGHTSEPISTVLAHDASGECDVQLIVHPSLRSAVLKFPLQSALAVVERWHFGNHAPQINAQQLSLLLAELEHYADRRPLPRRLI